MATPPIPPGYHSLQPYFIVRNAARAMDFYKELFGAEEIARMPMPGTDKLMHAELRIGDSVLMLADENDTWQVYSPIKYGGTPVSLMHYTTNVDATYAKAMALGCQSILAPADQFWGDRFCKFMDPFGHVWGVATHVFDPTPEQLAQGASQFAG